MNENLCGVFYTDGGCKPSRGFGGFGVHGYIYDDTKPTQGTGLKDWDITPSGYIPSNKKYSNADRMKIWENTPELAQDLNLKNVNVIEYIDVVGSIKGETTNIVAEIRGITQVLTIISDMKLKKVLILSDSEFVIDTLTKWVSTWKENGWKKADGSPVSNKEEIETMWNALQKVKSAGTDVGIRWLKGHDGNVGNEIADYYASLGVIVAKKRKSILRSTSSIPRGYWKSKVETNRLFSHRNWYFNSSQETAPKSNDGRFVYHIGDHGVDDDLVAKKAPDVSYAILYLEEPEETLETIRSTQSTLDIDKLNGIVIGKLQNIFKPKIYSDIQANGDLFLERKGVKLDIWNDALKTQLTYELRPPFLAFNLIEIFNILQGKLDNFLTKENELLKITDITDYIYEREIKKNNTICKIKPCINSSIKSIGVNVKYINKIKECDEAKITLTLNIDMPDRNTLAAISDTVPTVYVITWPESKLAFRYATIIETGNNIGIWAGYYSNIHIHSKC